MLGFIDKRRAVFSVGCRLRTSLSIGVKVKRHRKGAPKARGLETGIRHGVEWGLLLVHLCVPQLNTTNNKGCERELSIFTV